MLIDNETFQITNDKNKILVKTKHAKNSFLLKRSEYYLELAMLVEALKVEGWWDKKGRISITSKTPELIKLFESLLEEQGIKTSKLLNIRIKIPKEWNEKNKIESYENNKTKKFHFGRNGFSNELDRISFWSNFESSKYSLKYGDQKININTTITQNEFKISNSNSFVYCTLRASNKCFTTFLREILEEKTNSLTIEINEYLKTTPKEIIAPVFGVVVDCEGSINQYKLNRRIRVRMQNEKYLLEWKKLLKKVGISASINKGKQITQLTITSYQKFKKLKELSFNLNHQNKKNKFKKILLTYKKKQVIRNTAKKYYLNKLKKLNKKSTAKDFADRLNKKKRVISHYLKQLEKENLINVDKSQTTYLYSEKGLK